jgi:hypothetical protein
MKLSFQQVLTYELPGPLRRTNQQSSQPGSGGKGVVSGSLRIGEIVIAAFLPILWPHQRISRSLAVPALAPIHRFGNPEP